MRQTARFDPASFAGVESRESIAIKAPEIMYPGRYILRRARMRLMCRV